MAPPKISHQEKAERAAEGALTAKQRHALYTGQTIMASNHLHLLFFEIFCSVVGWSLGYALWHTVSSDANQRNMLDAVSRIHFSKQRGVLKRILWATRQAGALSTYRNDLVHVPIMMGTNSTGRAKPATVMAHPWGSYERVARLNSVQISKLRSLVLSDFFAIQRVVGRISTNLLHPDANYLLRRIPPLRAQAFVDAAKPKPPPRKKKKLPKRQRPASPP